MADPPVSYLIAEIRLGDALIAGPEGSKVTTTSEENIGLEREPHSTWPVPPGFQLRSAKDEHSTDEYLCPCDKCSTPSTRPPLASTAKAVGQRAVARDRLIMLTQCDAEDNYIIRN